MRMRLLVFVIALATCGPLPGGESDVALVEEVFFTSRRHVENIDSTTVWHGPDGERWLISSGKASHSLLVEDALNGGFIRRVGGLGQQLGQFNRPNGVWVANDYLFVVERDNRRVQVLSLPTFTAVGSLGETELTNPYGIYVRSLGKSEYSVYVTDNYETSDEEIPTDLELGNRIVHYSVELEGLSDGTMDFDLVGRFGETRGEGALRIVESIYGDPENERLLIAEEDNEHATSGFKVYGFDERFKETILARGSIKGQSEGIALVRRESGEGYWILTDQGMIENRFHVFDRRSLDYKGAFEGRYTLNTDGVWFDGTVSDRYPEGVFYAVHNDGNVGAFDWVEIKAALGIR